MTRSAPSTQIAVMAFLFAYRQFAILVKVPLMLPWRVVSAVINNTASNAAINAYSIAVTPDSSLIRLAKRVRKRFLLGLQEQSHAKMR
jgi:hypothetical protein